MPLIFPHEEQRDKPNQSINQKVPPGRTHPAYSNLRGYSPRLNLYHIHCPTHQAQPDCTRVTLSPCHQVRSFFSVYISLPSVFHYQRFFLPFHAVSSISPPQRYPSRHLLNFLFANTQVTPRPPLATPARCCFLYISYQNLVHPRSLSKSS